jgi:hypothetical protein
MDKAEIKAFTDLSKIREVREKITEMGSAAREVHV